MENNLKDVQLGRRGKTTYDWLPSNLDRLLDVGCSYGYFTKFYLSKCKKVYGIDPDNKMIEVGKSRCPQVEFKVARAEDLPFEEDYFDAVVLNDVFEHVDSERKSLDEIKRVLKKEGIVILTVPNKGLFRFLDVDNHSWRVRTYFPRLYNIFNKLRGKEIKVREGYFKKHRHYSIKEIKDLFENNFEITRFTRRGLFLGVFISNIELVTRLLFGEKACVKIRNILLPIRNFDYGINYGRWSRQLIVCARKLI
jgi:ubiquinone/menaquinone biosynthesis C-methylase UbiE|tara:strand:- start:61 stop:816 length:756 start_codon:yes stop_codon:yes gene_type:complete